MYKRYNVNINKTATAILWNRSQSMYSINQHLRWRGTRLPLCELAYVNLDQT